MTFTIFRGTMPPDPSRQNIAYSRLRNIKVSQNFNMPVQRLFFLFFRFIKESLLFQPNPQKSCKVLEREKKYHLSTYSNIMKKKNTVNEGVKKNHAHTKSPNNPAPSVVSKLKWLVPNIQVPKSMPRDRPLEKLVSW